MIICLHFSTPWNTAQPLFCTVRGFFFYNKHESHVFDINGKKNSKITRSKARVVFSVFDITNYAFDSDFQHFEQPFNSGVHLMEKVKRYRKPSLETGKIGCCHCNTPIIHSFEVRSHITTKNIYHKFADTDTLENMKQVSRVIIKHNCTKEKKEKK